MKNCTACNMDEGWPICLRDDRCPHSPAPIPGSSVSITPPQAAMQGEALTPSEQHDIAVWVKVAKLAPVTGSVPINSGLFLKLAALASKGDANAQT